MEQLELISISSQESEDSHSQQDGQESKPSHSAKSKNTLNESSEKTSLEFGYSKTFGHSQQLNFASLGSLPEDTRASLSPKLGSAEEQKTTVTSGLRCSELSDHQGQFGCFVKMLLVTSRWVSTKSSLIWKVKNTPSSRLLFQLRPSMQDTAETASGLWATVTDRDYKGPSGRAWKGISTDLPTQVTQRQIFPTPRAREGNAGNIGSKGSIHNMKKGYLDGVIQEMFPTPTTQDSKNDGGPSQFDRNTIPLNAHVKIWPTPFATPRGAHTGERAGQVSENGKTRTSAKGIKFGATLQTAVGSGSLNPTWVEWLMGYPIGWTDLKDSETQSSHKSHTRSSEP